GDLVADAPRRVLVDRHRAEVGEVERTARAQHRVGERRRLLVVEAPEVDRHEPGSGLILRDGPARHPLHEGRDLGRLEPAAVPFPRDPVEHSHGVRSGRLMRVRAEGSCDPAGAGREGPPVPSNGDLRRAGASRPEEPGAVMRRWIVPSFLVAALSASAWLVLGGSGGPEPSTVDVAEPGEEEDATAAAAEPGAAGLPPGGEAGRDNR